MRLVKTLVLGSLLAAAGSGLHGADANSAGHETCGENDSLKSTAKKSAKTTASTTPAESTEKVARRDPFESLTSRQDAAAKNAAICHREKRDCRSARYGWMESCVRQTE